MLVGFYHHMALNTSKIILHGYFHIREKYYNTFKIGKKKSLKEVWNPKKNIIKQA